MSIMRCEHCDRRYDSDFDEWCPSCSQKELRHSELELKPGETCIWCGAEYQEQTVESYYAKKDAKHWTHGGYYGR